MSATVSSPASVTVLLVAVMVPVFVHVSDGWLGSPKLSDAASAVTLPALSNAPYNSIAVPGAALMVPAAALVQVGEVTASVPAMACSLPSLVKPVVCTVNVPYG